MRKSEFSGVIITEPLYYITNQYNLREILSGGFIGNRSSFDDKYYDDLLVEANGRIPLFTAPVDRSLIQRVNEHDPETSFPVILQLDPAGIEKGASALFNEQVSDGDSRLVCIGYAGVISLKNITAIHFLSIDNLSEFAVRSYSNMPNPRELYKVTPGLVSEQVHQMNVLSRLREIPQTLRPNHHDFSSLDRISGAVSLCIHYSKGKEQSRQLLKLLETVRKSRKPDEIPYWFDVGLEARTKEEISSLKDLNELVFASTITVLHSYSLNSVSQKSKIFEEIKALVYSNSVSEENRTILDKSFTRIEKLLRLEEDFGPFKTSAGQDALRGLLLFLLRPRHKELLSWDLAETNASHNAMLTALAYAGIVIGRKGLETEYRPAKVDLEISNMIVAALGQSAEQKSVAGKKTARNTKSKAAKNQSPAMMVQSGPFDAEPMQASTLMDWVTIRKRILDGDKDSPELVAAAIQFCKEMGWGDCITTVVHSSVKEKFLIESGEKSTLVVRLSGFPQIMHELDFDLFRINISKLELPEAVHHESEAVSS